MRRHIKSDSSSTDGKKRILDAAVSVFSRYGYDGTTVRMISERAGMSPSLINYHWPGKEALWAEVCDICKNRINDILWASADFSLPLEEAIPDFIGKLFDALVENQDLMRIFNWGILEAESIDYQRTRGAWQPLTDFGKGYLQNLKNEGKIGDVDIEIALMMIRALFIMMFTDRHGQLYAFGKDLNDPEHARRVKASFIKAVQGIIGYPLKP
jgi:AcrR family transcriptional regulator